MSVNLPAADVAVLRRLAKRRNTTMTQIICQAIGSEMYFDKIRSAGGTVLLKSKRGAMREVVFR